MQVRITILILVISIVGLGCSRSGSAPPGEKGQTSSAAEPRADNAKSAHLGPKTSEEARRRLEMAIVLLSRESHSGSADLANKILATIIDSDRLSPELRDVSRLLLKGKINEAVMLILAADNRGSIDARQLHAMCWLHGLKLPVKHETAHLLLESAGRASQGRAAGQAGRMYELGVGCTKSFGFAEQMYELGVEAGDIDSQAALGALLIRSRSLTRGFQHLRRAAERGSLEAACGLAKCLALGWGTTANTQQAEIWFRRAAEFDVSEAQLGLAILLAEKRDDPSAAKESSLWLQRAAENGDLMAVALLRQQPSRSLERALARQQELVELRAVPDDVAYPFDRDPMAPTLFADPRTSGYSSQPTWTEEGLRQDHLERALIDTSQTRGWEERHWFKAHW